MFETLNRDCFLCRLSWTISVLTDMSLSRVLFLGDTNVGKTCLAQLYLKEQVLDDSVVTIGFDYDDKDVDLESGISVKVSSAEIFYL